MTKNQNKRIGLYFGSFNPFHYAHTALVESALAHTLLDEIWIIVSPHNPLKESKDLAPEEDRARMAELALAHIPKAKVSRVEFDLSKPSYTYQTLRLFHEKYPNHNFYFIVGADTINSLESWRNADEVIQSYPFIIVHREGIELNKNILSQIKYSEIDNNLTHSSTKVRDMIKDGRDPRHLIHKDVDSYIKTHKLYM